MLSNLSTFLPLECVMPEYDPLTTASRWALCPAEEFEACPESNGSLKDLKQESDLPWADLQF